MTRLIGIALFVLFFLWLYSMANARDDGQWQTADPEVATWYRSLKQPDNTAISCCGEADAYWADSMVIEGEKFFAVVTDDRPDAPFKRPHIPVGTRFEVPPHKIKRDGGNPTGHFILFVGVNGMVFCYVTGTLG